MKLYEVPRNTWVRVRNDAHIPPAHREFEDGERIFFDHLDGMYSFCHDEHGNIVHLYASSEVEVDDSSSQQNSS